MGAMGYCIIAILALPQEFHRLVKSKIKSQVLGEYQSDVINRVYLKLTQPLSSQNDFGLANFL